MDTPLLQPLRKISERKRGLATLFFLELATFLNRYPSILLEEEGSAIDEYTFVVLIL